MTNNLISLRIQCCSYFTTHLGVGLNPGEFKHTEMSVASQLYIINSTEQSLLYILQRSSHMLDSDYMIYRRTSLIYAF